jgi:hypothetical protein
VGRQARDVEVFLVDARDRQLVDGVLDALANDVELALERRSRPHGRHDARLGRRSGRRAGLQARPCSNENLLEIRLHRRGRGAHETIVGRQIAPAEQRLPFLLDDRLNQRFDGGARGRVARQKNQAGAVFADRRQGSGSDLAKKLVRRLHEDAGAVAGVHLAAAGAAVQQVDEKLKRLPHDGVRAHALDVDNEANATCVFLETRIVESLAGRTPRFAVHKRRSSYLVPEAISKI